MQLQLIFSLHVPQPLFQLTVLSPQPRDLGMGVLQLLLGGPLDEKLFLVLAFRQFLLFLCFVDVLVKLFGHFPMVLLKPLDPRLQLLVFSQQPVIFFDELVIFSLNLGNHTNEIPFFFQMSLNILKLLLYLFFKPLNFICLVNYFSL